MRKFADDGAPLFDSAQEGTPLYQFQIVHDAKPSVTYGFLAAFKAFLLIADEQTPDFQALAYRSPAP